MRRSRRVLAALFALMVALSGASVVLAASETARDRTATERSVEKPRKCNKKKTKKARKKCRKRNKGGGQTGGGQTGGGQTGGGQTGGGNGGTDAGPARPMDYIAQADMLSQPQYSQTVTETLTVEAHDGEELYMEITRPDPAVYGESRLPVILEASPYHGTLADRAGTRMFPDPLDAEGRRLGLTGYFAPRGYAVAMMDLRGTGRSTGCLDHLGQDDAQDLKTVIEWLADQSWSNGRVGMTGHSYVAGTQAVAAAQDPEGLVTIVPSAGLASMYDHQYNKGVPWSLQWVGPMYAYEQIALYRDLPPGVPTPPVVGGGPSGDNFENGPNPQTGCGLQNSSAISGTGQVTGQYEAWHADRDWTEGAADADIPIFMIHGVNDNAARIPAAEWFFGDRMQAGDKVWLGQWDHGSTNGRCGDVYGFRALHPTCRFEQMQYAIHAWFDKHLMQRDVDTGPPVEVFLNGETPVSVTQVMDPERVDGKVYAAQGWEQPDLWQDLYLDATDMSLSPEAPAEEGSDSFASTAQGVLIGAAGNLTFSSEPVAEDTLFLGLPELRLDTSLTTGQITHLTAQLNRVSQDGSREPMNFCAIQPQLRDGIDQIAPVVPGEVMALDLQCFTMGHWVPAGQSLELVISTRTQHHATFGSADQEITIHTGPEGSAYRLPVQAGATLYEDVALHETYPVLPPPGPAQAGYSGSVIVPAPGAGEVVEPVTAAAYEFDIHETAEDGTAYDNARMEIVATPMVFGDLDLYLERQTPDGWQSITAAESGSNENEVLAGGRLPAGHYRVVVHNWAAVAGEVSVEITFFNRDDVPGSGTAEGTSSETFLVHHSAFGYLPQA